MKINILITAFNQEKYIEQCVASALQQDYADVSVVVSDNGSIDRTSDILKQFLHDKRFVY
jgi:glycosyltransferase involved in cell wall biosynthesis